jgi:hypothetical protein
MDDVQDVQGPRHDVSILINEKLKDAKTLILQWHPTIRIKVCTDDHFNEDIYRYNSIRLLVVNDVVIDAEYN